MNYKSVTDYLHRALVVQWTFSSDSCLCPICVSLFNMIYSDCMQIGNGVHIYTPNEKGAYVVADHVLYDQKSIFWPM